MSSTNTTLSLNASDTQYGYIPTQWVCIVFLAVFGLTTFVHVIQAIFYRIWWLLPTAALCGVGELIGWAARLWSSINPWNGNAFLMQISTTIIAPTPFVAANFVIFGILIERVGTQFSLIRPRLYTIIFCCADVVALVIQGTGGGLASSATTVSGSVTGGHIVLAGIVIQLVFIIGFSGLIIDFLVRLRLGVPHRKVPEGSFDEANPEKPILLDTKTRLAFAQLCISTLFIFIRSIYRTAELVNGWNGRIIQTQRYFNFLDGMMICLAMITMNLLHPGWLMGRGIKSSKI